MWLGGIIPFLFFAPCHSAIASNWGVHGLIELRARTWFVVDPPFSRFIRSARPHFSVLSPGTLDHLHPTSHIGFLFLWRLSKIDLSHNRWRRSEDKKCWRHADSNPGQLPLSSRSSTNIDALDRTTILAPSVVPSFVCFKTLVWS